MTESDVGGTPDGGTPDGGTPDGGTPDGGTPDGGTPDEGTAGALDAWADRLAAALGLDLDVDIALLLDVARDAAHGVARPAAPLTTFLVGYAAARAGGSAADVAEAARIAQSLALGQAPAGPARPHDDGIGTT